MTHFENIAAALKGRGLDAMLVTSEPGEFYAVGFHGEGAALITPDKTWYYTDSRYIEAARQLISGAEVILWTAGNGFREQIAALVKAHGVAKLGFEEEYMSVSSHTAWTKAVEAQFLPASELLTTLRQVKDAGELAAMREAQRVTDEALLAAIFGAWAGLIETPPVPEGLDRDQREGRALELWSKEYPWLSFHLSCTCYPGGVMLFTGRDGGTVCLPAEVAEQLTWEEPGLWQRLIGGGAS